MINFVENHLVSIERRPNPVVQLLRKVSLVDLAEILIFFC